MDQALKSLMASEEEVVTSLDLSGQCHLLAAHLPFPSQHSGCSLSPAKGWEGPGLPNSACCHSHHLALLFSPPPFPHCASLLSHLTVPSHPTLPHTPAVNVGT